MAPGNEMTGVQGAARPGGGRVLLLVPARTYRAADFLTAAARLGLDLVTGSDGALPLGGLPAGRIRRILATAGRAGSEPLLVEEYVPGWELSIDGLLDGGELTVAAVFDKPGAPEGPTFEETVLITPSRLPVDVLSAAVRTAG